MIFPLVLIIGTATGFDFRCPVPAEWRLRANVYCSSEAEYVCLFHLLDKKYQDVCLRPDQSSLGSKLVFQPFFNLKECNAGRYQPIVFTTYGNSECILQKTKCAEEGQIVYTNGFSSNDTACRCDYRHGYSFVKTPKKSCFCIPSEEDCSCFRVSCTKLSPDYRCITDGEVTTNTKCLEIHPQIAVNRHKSSVRFIMFTERKAKGYFNAHYVAYIIIAIVAVNFVLVLSTVHIFVRPQILSHETIELDGRNIGLKCCVRSYFPLTSVVWYEEPGNKMFRDTKSYDVFSMHGIKVLTYERSGEYDPATLKCIVENKFGTVESDPVQLNDDNRRMLIHELMQKKECGKLHFAKLVFIGKNGVGKTSLMRRLLWQNKGDVTSTKSTDGIEVEKCNINITNGKWSPCNETKDDLIRLIRKCYPAKNKIVKRAAGENVAEDVQLIYNTEEAIVESVSEVSRSSDEHDDIGKINVESDSESSKNEEMNTSRSINESFTSENIDDNETVYTGLNEKQPKHIKFKNVYENNISNKATDSDPVFYGYTNQLTSKIMKSYLQRSGKESYDTMASCSLWDFAGQKDFYVTHQVFLSNCAVILLVTDSLDFSTDERPGIDLEDSTQYVNFWFDAIHCYGSTTKKGRLDPPIIVVCTNGDKFKEPPEQQKRRQQFIENLKKNLRKQKKKNHLREIYFVSNTEDDDNVFEEIREGISRQAMQMNDWGRVCPLKWLLFQQILGKLKESGVPISTTKQLFKIATHDDIGISNNEEFKLCLQYCHDNGTVIYFEEKNLEDHVILDPKWLVDAFRCLVSDKIETEIQISDHWQNLIETGELTDKLITGLFKKEPHLKFSENKIHLLEVMKRFDIIVNLKNSTALYMPCMMEPCSFEKVIKQFIDERPSFYRTSWLCLDFEFLPPAFFNHILAWYIRQYSVSVLTEKETRNERKALYRQIGVFDLDLSGCEQLVVCEGPNVIALQVWNSRRSDKTYGDFRRKLCQFIDTLRNRYRLKITFTKSFKCKDGDFTINRKKMNILLTKYYRCLEHKRNHISEDLVQPWYVDMERRQEKNREKELMRPYLRTYRQPDSELDEDM